MTYCLHHTREFIIIPFVIDWFSFSKPHAYLNLPKNFPPTFVQPMVCYRINDNEVSISVKVAKGFGQLPLCEAS
jgi:hypothetical protein